MDAKEPERGKIISLTHCYRRNAQELSNRVGSPRRSFTRVSLKLLSDLHVDDGYMTGPAEKMMEVFAYLEGENCVETFHPSLEVGNSFEHVGAQRDIDDEGMWVKKLDKYESSVLTMMQMKDCRPSTSPKLEKQAEPGDDDPCEQPELHRSAVCTILYMTKRRPDLQAHA